jgi:hypothetical protein
MMVRRGVLHFASRGVGSVFAASCVLVMTRGQSLSLRVRPWSV